MERPDEAPLIDRDLWHEHARTHRGPEVGWGRGGGRGGGGGGGLGVGRQR